MTEKLDLLIINPAASHGIYGALGDELIAVEPPLWCRLIAGYVRDRGFSVEILDAEATHDEPEDVAMLAASKSPRLVCLAVYGHQPSASTQQMSGASKTARALRWISNLPIVMVGGHPSALPQRTLAEEDVDFVCVGEGPVTVVALLEALRAAPHPLPDSVLEKVPGLVWAPDGFLRPGAFENPTSRIRVNPPAPLIENMDELHGDAWDLLPMGQYRAHNWQCFGDLGKRKPYASIFTTLGCPYKCSFCCINAPFGTNRYRMRDPFAVAVEILKLHHEYGVGTFKIVDEMFVLNERHYTTICKHLLLHPEVTRDLNIWAYARVDTVKPDTLALLRSAGIRWLALGIESGSKYVRDGAQKRLKNDDIAAVVKAIQAADINVIGNFIFGLPDDDERTMRETLDLALELRCDFSNFYSAMAYPGSPLYTEAVAKGWTLPETWRGFSQHNSDSRPLDTLHVDAATVLRFRDEAFTRYFTDPGYLAMVERKWGAETLAHVRAMTGYKLKRKLLEVA